MTDLDRSTPPGRGTLRSFDFPAVARRVLPTGLDLRVAIMNRLPMVSLNLFLRAGEGAVRPEVAGLAVLTADALEGGTRRRDGSELAEALESIGARVSAAGGWEGTSIGLSCLAERLPEALAILAEMVLEPAFPSDEVQRAREQQLASIRQRAMDPAALATDTALARYFDPEIPYARPVDGTVGSIGAMTPDMMHGFADANYKPSSGGLVVVGDVDPGEVRAMVAEYLGSWEGEPASRADFTAAARTTERTVTVVHRPGATQSEIRVGHVGAARKIPDYYPLSIANLVLGGMFTSRLNLNLRERHGFTYGVRSRFTYRVQAGPFQVSTAVGNEVTAAALEQIMLELASMAGEGPTSEEVEAARDYAAGVFGLQIETARQVATRVTQLVVYDLPDDHFDRYRDEVRAVTREEAAQAASRYIRPEQAQIVVVGDAEVVSEPLRALDLGPMEVVGG